MPASFSSRASGDGSWPGGRMDVEVLSKLIGDIYDASLNRDLWSKVLEDTCAFIGGCAAVLFSQDPSSRSGRFVFNWGDDPDFTEAFFRTYVRISPLTPHLMMTKPGDVFAASRLMPYEELAASRLFQEWASPQGYVDLVGATLEKNAASLATLSVSRDTRQGLVTDDAVRRMQLLAPHFRRAVLISRVIELHKIDAEMMSETLDGIAAGLFLVDDQAGVVYANRRGKDMLRDGEVMASASSSTLSLFDAEANRILRSAIADAGAGDAAVATQGIAIPLGSASGERLVAHLMPLTSGARLAAGIAHTAVAAVFIRKAAIDLPLPIEAAARQFHLTPSEIRVLYAVMETGGVAAMAATLGISEWTVKTHLVHLFEKTGAATQTELVKLVAGLASPLVL